MSVRISTVMGVITFFCFINGASGETSLPCDVTLTEIDSIQDAVDNVGEGGVVCLETGTYIGGGFPVELDSRHIGLTLRAAEGASPTLHGRNIAIVMDAAHEVTISGLTLQNSTRHRLLEINRSDNVTITDNVFWPVTPGGIGVFVKSLPDNEGKSQKPNGVVLRGNMFDRVETGVIMENCTGCSIIDNKINTWWTAIFIKASNSAGTPVELTQGVTVANNEIAAHDGGVVVSVSSSGLISSEHEPEVSLKVVSLHQNKISARRPITAWAVIDPDYNSNSSRVTLKNLSVIRNDITCEPQLDGSAGLTLTTISQRGSELAMIENTKVIRNVFSGCDSAVDKIGNVERTALSPDLQELLDHLDAVIVEEIP